MTIHHDKLAYGKLAAASEEISADVIEEMNRKLARLQQAEEENEKKNTLPPEKKGDDSTERKD